MFASRGVPGGVDATTAEWEGGATRFIHAGLLCTVQEKKEVLLPPFGELVKASLFCILHSIFFFSEQNDVL